MKFMQHSEPSKSVKARLLRSLAAFNKTPKALQAATIHAANTGVWPKDVPLPTNPTLQDFEVAAKWWDNKVANAS